MSFDPYKLGETSGASQRPGGGAESATPPSGSTLSPDVQPVSLAPSFASDNAPASAFSAAGPPLIWLALAGGAALLSVIASVVSWQLWGLGVNAPIAAVSWLLSGPLAIGLIAVFMLQDTARRAHPFYVTSGVVKPSYWVVLGLALLGVMLSSVHLAFWIGRL